MNTMLLAYISSVYLAKFIISINKVFPHCDTDVTSCLEEAPIVSKIFGSHLVQLHLTASL